LGTTQFRRAVLTGKQNFDRLFGQGVYLQSSGVSLLVCDATQTDPTRFAICVSKKIGKAVRRNRLRRVTRESLDPMVSVVRKGHHVALFPGRRFLELAPGERERTLARALKRAGLWDESVASGRSSSDPARQEPE
jgi:ribonuclease P protein component